MKHEELYSTSMIIVRKYVGLPDNLKGKSMYGVYPHRLPHSAPLSTPLEACSKKFSSRALQLS